MNTLRITGITTLSLLFGMAAPAYAQHEQHGEKQDHPQQQQGEHKQAKPEQKQQHAQQQQRPEQNKQQQHAQQQRRQDQNKQEQHAQQQQKQNKQQPRAQQQQRRDQNTRQEHAQERRSIERPQRTRQQRVEHSAWQQHRSQRWESDHRDWRRRGGYNGYRIPDDRYRGYFGRDHGFRIYGLPFLVVGGYPRFQYQGYWISLVDPWPEYWGNNWYDNDDVYVAYVDNGYYLYDRRYPNIGMAISISM